MAYSQKEKHADHDLIMRAMNAPRNIESRFPPHLRQFAETLAPLINVRALARQCPCSAYRLRVDVPHTLLTVRDRHRLPCVYSRTPTTFTSGSFQ